MSISWKKISEKPDRAGFRKILHKTFQLPDGSEHEFTTVDYGVGVALLIGLTPDNKFVIARQFRPGPEAIMDEIPGGFIDAGEDHAQAAVREFREETGFASDAQPEFLGALPRDAYLTGKAHYYLLRDVRKVEEIPDSGEHEFIDIVEISADEMIANCTSGKLTDAGGGLLALRHLGL